MSSLSSLHTLSFRHGCVCVRISECLRRRCCQPSRPPPSPTHTHTRAHTHPPYLHNCSLVHWETSRWCHSCVNIAMATPLFPLPTTPVTCPHPPTSRHTHTPTFLRRHPVQDKLNLHGLQAIVEKSSHGSSLFQRTVAKTLLFFCSIREQQHVKSDSLFKRLAKGLMK